MSIIRWVALKAKERVNVTATWRELKELRRKYGRRFFFMAVIWELIEDVLFPFLSYKAGYPELIPLFLVLHFEPIVYPIFFWCFRMWDRIQGREPWEPDRLAMSAYWRTALKMITHRMISIVVFLSVLSATALSFGVLAVYTGGMTLFGFVHDRLWHDSNFGIDIPTDHVKPIRVIVKTLTYRTVSAIVMCGVFYGLTHEVPANVWFYQGLMLPIYFGIGIMWARSSMGIQPIQREDHVRSTS